MARCDYDYGKPFQVPYTPGGAVGAGDIIVLADSVVIAHSAIAAGANGDVSRRGAVYKNIPKASGDGGWGDGAKLYFHTTNNVLQTSATGSKPFGFAVGAAGDTATAAGALHEPF